MSNIDSRSFDIAIVCALARPELEKVLETGEAGWEQLSGAENDPSTYYASTFMAERGAQLSVVASAATQMGMPASAILATKMILRFRPKLVAMVGIAAGVKSGKQNYGDILVPNRTFDYGAGKLQQVGDRVELAPDPDPIRLSERLRARIDQWSSKRLFLDEISQSWPLSQQRTRLQVHVGPLGSGSAVVDTSQPMLDVLDHWRKLVGVEMEAYGAHLATQTAVSPAPEFICMKSICDFATAKTDDWQDYAAFTASRLLHRFLVNEWENLFLDPR
ncbi:MAG: hypothetical protein H6816_15870 [Phycisphaerales bacterium]|nr:hypothetical protein [Phycisphaerales bacterium]